MLKFLSSFRIPRNSGLPLYMNECDASQNVFATYGDLQFLRDTYAKYDPTRCALPFSLVTILISISISFRFNVRFTDGPIGL